MTGKKWRGLLVALALTITQMSMAATAQAQINNIQIEFAASAPTTYVHTAGGGAWNGGQINTNIVRSLEGYDFKCDDIVSYLTKISVADTPDIQALGSMTLDMNYSISMDTTGQSGVALGEPVVAVVNSPDSGNSPGGNSSASVVATSQTGAMFTKGAELLKTIRVTNVDAKDVIIVRMDVKIYCKTGTAPSGNLQVKFSNAFVVAKNGGTEVNPAEQVKIGEQTISLKNVEAFGVPAIAIAKTVTTASGTCPGQESITIEPTQQVKFCYVVTNPSNAPGKIGAPLYNVTTIADDNGQYPDFTVTLTSGLTDIDNDGQADDLAVGGTATGSYVIAFDGDKDSVITNIATVSGFGSPNGGTQYTAQDSATVNVDAPQPALTLSKLTNGSDGPSILVGSAVTWTYQVTNTGDRALSNVHVTDDQGVTVVCPSSTLAISASMTCTATGTAVAGNYVNLGTAFGSWDSQVETATDTSSYFGANPAIDIQKAPDTQTVVEGQKASFNITVTNTGNVPLTGVVVSDALSSDCAKSIGALAVAGQSTYSCLSDSITANMTNVASVVGYWNTTQVTDNDSANVVVDYLPNIEVTKSANPESVVETGANVTFTFSVKNKAPEDFTMTSMSDDKFGNMNGQGTCVVPQTIAAGATYSCALTVFLSSDSLTAHTNIVTVQGHDPQDHPGSGSDSATVTFTDVLPSLSVTKTANPTVVPESGGNVTFTFVVTNNSLEALSLKTLDDNKFGDLNGQGTCSVPRTIAGSGSYTCAVTKPVGDWTLTPFVNVVTASGQDNEGNWASDSATATVNFTDLKPTISVVKTVNPTIIRSTGDWVDYTFRINNIGPESVTVTSFIDTAVALSADCQALVGKWIPVSGYVECVTHIFMNLGVENSLLNVATANAQDNEGNIASASGSALLKTYWYGRTPGYWKNHSEAWISGYLPGQYIQDVFVIPTALKSGTILDLDGNKAKDTLIAGLAYKGGSQLSGAAQILMRAAIAALLNKAYYGADYPAETSIDALIAHVNTILATQSRDEYLTWATYYDKWNNGVEGALP